MNDFSINDFFAALGFEEGAIEDGLTALIYEPSEDGAYAIISDENGNIPTDLKARAILACYTPDGAYDWSINFKSARLFKEKWSSLPAEGDKLVALKEICNPK